MSYIIEDILCERFVERIVFNSKFIRFCADPKNAHKFEHKRSAENIISMLNIVPHTDNLGFSSRGYYSFRIVEING
jgi:hypothetical protein